MAERLTVLRSQLRRGLTRISYRDAESLALELAARLVAQVGRVETRRLQYAAVPRGGVIVLGMLAYALDLGWKNLAPPRKLKAPLVVVDDCSLTGARFGQLLRQATGRRLIFAHLYSHPNLRASIRAAEPAVIACVAARDLRDLAPEILTPRAEYERWRRRAAGRLPGRRYWVGLPEIVVFPWSEPDTPFWDSKRRALEVGWRTTPPDRCLKNWAVLGLPPRSDTTRTVRSGDEVAYLLDDDRTVLYNGKTGRSCVLGGMATDTWRALAAWGDPAAAAEYLIEFYDVSPDRLRVDVEAVLHDLLARGFLERVGDASHVVR